MASVPEQEIGAPGRLSVLLANAAPVAAVLRRGPTRWVQLVKWQTDCDHCEAGQWFRGRIYDRRSDLSPDGSLFLYFASKFNRRTLTDRDYTYAWTAISQLPYFTALALWPKGDCWHGGGIFQGLRSVWLNHNPFDAPHPKHQPAGLTVEPNPDCHGEDYPVWSRRMQRDGWVLLQKGDFQLAKRGWHTVRPEIWERKCPVNARVLRRSTDALNFRHPGGPYVESFRLVLPTGKELILQDAAWADWDQAGRLVFAKGGKLYTGVIDSGFIVERALIDLNANQPTRVQAPEWARRWPC